MIEEKARLAEEKNLAQEEMQRREEET